MSQDPQSPAQSVIEQRETLLKEFRDDPYNAMDSILEDIGAFREDVEDSSRARKSLKENLGFKDKFNLFVMDRKLAGSIFANAGQENNPPEQAWRKAIQLYDRFIGIIAKGIGNAATVGILSETSEHLGHNANLLRAFGSAETADLCDKAAAIFEKKYGNAHQTRPKQGVTANTL